jgi:3-methyladenine DNA glycosylase AlkD
MLAVQKEIRKKARPAQAKILQRFFKTGPGEYGEGDVFIGLKSAELKEIAKNHRELNFNDLKVLLKSEIHEDRAVALVILTLQYAKDKSSREKIYQFYIKHSRFINNWDLVDVSAYKIVGRYTFDNNSKEDLRKYILSKNMWQRRIAMVSTFYWIREKSLDLTYEFAVALLEDNEDLSHKASGWMLREAGKRDLQSLRKFLAKYGAAMPRTMLRYAIEKFPEAERKKILLETRTK